MNVFSLLRKVDGKSLLQILTGSEFQSYLY